MKRASIVQLGQFLFTVVGAPHSIEAWTTTRRTTRTTTLLSRHPLSAAAAYSVFPKPTPSALYSSSTEEDQAVVAATDEVPVYDYDVPDDAVIDIKPNAMRRLRELRDQQATKNGGSDELVLRMGVRSGGCSGMSYVMDFSTKESIQDDDAVDEYPTERIRCVVDAKSLLYLYGLQLDYSDQLIGGGFKFTNPNAGESCGCGSSFGV